MSLNKRESLLYFGYALLEVVSNGGKESFETIGEKCGQKNIYSYIKNKYQSAWIKSAVIDVEQVNNFLGDLDVSHYRAENKYALGNDALLFLAALCFEEATICFK